MRVLNSILFIKYDHSKKILVNSIILLSGFILTILGTFIA